MCTWRALFSLGFLFVGLSVQAEPWLADRFSQNCASCHSPGRVNRPVAQRRCTITCQGCHVNPSGGGMRNLYGKWLTERWLSSANLKAWEIGKPKPAPLADQPYEKQRLAKNPIDPRVELPTLKIVEGPVDEAHYSRSLATQDGVIETDHNKFMISVPRGDPLRETESINLIGGIDFRTLTFTRTLSGNTKQYSFPVAIDFGAQLRTFRKFSLVAEGRFANGPSASKETSEWDNLYINKTLVKSAYMMIDDLSYNSWFIYGVHRPMFGNSDPDHTSLYNSLTYGTTPSMRGIYKTVSVGTSMNMPFINLNYFSPVDHVAYSQDKGYILNIGGRLMGGSSVLFAYWNSDAATGPVLRREMVLGSITGKAGRWTGIFDINRMRRTDQDTSTHAGTAVSLQNKFRMWRETYFLLNYAKSNTAADLTYGESSEVQLGLKSFMLAGLEFELIASRLQNAPYVDEDRLQAQLHFFY